MEEEIVNCPDSDTKENDQATELIIKTHDFEEAKSKIKHFADSAPSSPEFRTFSTSDGPFGWFPHRVTGDELNKFLTTLQEHLMSFNQRDDEFINEFRHVYEAFESLDKDYIQAILIAVKSAEKASQEAKDAQQDVDLTIERLHQAIESLSKFKTEINSYSHLKDIDKIWEDVEGLKKIIANSASRSTKGKRKKARSIEVSFNSYSQETDTIQQLREQNTRMARRNKLLSVLVGCSLIAVAVEIVLHITGVL